jgi:hypothetical protein
MESLALVITASLVALIDARQAAGGILIAL